MGRIWICGENWNSRQTSNDQDTKQQWACPLYEGLWRGCMIDTNKACYIMEKLESQGENLALFWEALEKRCWRLWEDYTDSDIQKKMEGGRIKISKITWKLIITFLRKWPKNSGHKKKRDLKKKKIVEWCLTPLYIYSHVWFGYVSAVAINIQYCPCLHRA